MASIGIGDLSQSFLNARQMNNVKTKLYTLNTELNTGRVSDLSRHLGGNATQLNAIDRDLAVLAGFNRTNQTLQNDLSRLQVNLASINDLRGAMAAQFVVTTPDSLEGELREAGRRAIDEMSAIVNRINARSGDRSLLSGPAVDTDPLASADIMLADIVAQIGAATDVDTIVATIDQWFDDPAGGFATVGYLGDTGGLLTRRIGSSDQITINARADDEAIKSVLKGTALAAVTQALPTTLSRDTQADLLRRSAETLFSASAPLTELQAKLGRTEERVFVAQTEQAARTTALSIARNDLVQADPYDTATRLQEVQRQLELQFTTTARLSQLSLVNYL